MPLVATGMAAVPSAPDPLSVAPYMHDLAFVSLFVISWAEFPDRIDQHAEVIGVDIRRYTVTQVEYVSRPPSVAFQYI